MGLLTFIKDAGERLFGTPPVKTAHEQVASDPSGGNVAALNRAAGDAILAYIGSLGLKATALTISFANARVTAHGVAPDQATREKILLAAGNVEGVEGVVDMMTVDLPAPEARFHTVVRGDNLSRIARQVYGDANKYPAIFEANKPMLTHPDKIYPGQVLRLPAL